MKHKQKMEYMIQLSYLVGNDSVNLTVEMGTFEAAIAYIQLHISPGRYVSAFITSGDTSWLLTSDDGSELDGIRRGEMATSRVQFPNTAPPSLMQYMEDVRTHQRRPRGEDHDGSMDPSPAKTAKFW